MKSMPMDFYTQGKKITDLVLDGYRLSNYYKIRHITPVEVEGETGASIWFYCELENEERMIVNSRFVASIEQFE